VIFDLIDQVRSKAVPLHLENRGVLLCNLIILHQIISASENLLVEAAKEATGDLKEYYTHHLEEERQHEKWLADDLATAGIDVKQLPLDWDAADMAGSQYYLIKHVDPAALLGYMAVLECYPFPMQQLETLEMIHGKPLLRCLRYHAENDPQHGDDLKKVLAKHSSPLVMSNAVRTQQRINAITRKLSELC
jgi:hypothetical protein